MEYLEKLQYLLLTMFVVGFGLPLINVILGALSSSGDVEVEADFDADVPDADFDLDIDLDIDAPDLPDIDVDANISDLRGARDIKSGRDGLKFNMNCLCLAMVIFSAVSYYRIQFAQNAFQLLTILIVDAAIAFAAYIVLFYFVIKKLKSNDASAFKSQNLLHKRGIVKIPVIEGKIGKIELKDALGASITYLAKIDRDICKETRIPAGKEIIVTEVDRQNNICYVAVPETKTIKK